MGEIGQGVDRLILAPAARRESVLQMMRAAQHELILSMFRCDDLTIVDELASAVKRGVNVRVLITQRARGWKERLKDLTALIRSLGADVRPYENPLMKYHAKYVVMDNGLALVTSLNFTRKCFEETSDFLIFTEQAEVISGLKALFENDSNTPAAPHPPITERLIVGPEGARQRITDQLRNASQSIKIIDHRVTDQQIIALLQEKQAQGVSVQVLGNISMGGLVWHGRMILVDDEAAIIGSIHLSPPSLDSRREVAIVVEDPALVAELYDYFQSLALNEVNLISTLAATPPTPEAEEDEEDE